MTAKKMFSEMNEDDLDEALLKAMSKKKKTHNKKVPREPFTVNHLERIIHYKSNTWRQRSVFRFQLIAFLMFATGLRLSDVAPLTEDQLRTLVNEGELPIKISKQNILVTIRLSEAMKQFLFNFCYQKTTIRNLDLLGWYFASAERYSLGGINLNKLTSTFNGQLRQVFDREFTTIDGFSLSSHSFRIGFINRNLDRGVGIENTAELVFHRSWKSTATYSRYKLDTKDRKVLLDKLDENLSMNKLFTPFDIVNTNILSPEKKIIDILPDVDSTNL